MRWTRPDQHLLDDVDMKADELERRESIRTAVLATLSVLYGFKYGDKSDQALTNGFSESQERPFLYDTL